MTTDCFTPLEPAELAACIDAGRADITMRLKGALGTHTVVFLGAMRSPSGNYDEFAVTSNGTSTKISDDELAYIRAQGCAVVSTRDRIARVSCVHTNYDRRALRTDLSAAQKAIVVLLVLLSLLFAIAGLAV